ncbi:hypothetical protein Ddye_024832 [Dipteronia dyeriana]|uniref:Uncharacterized protein n=1 Tax=Dipteronia dyeriana TaxID=168575 RepID=A0AAD9TWL4_9ROSI|nr:hypothetical protein Ddye_024832 [Dipteronia dyeriana]
MEFPLLQLAAYAQISSVKKPLLNSFFIVLLLDQAASCSPINANLSDTAKTTAAASTKLPSLPSWLPPGWQMDSKVRTSGASAGEVDKSPGNTKSHRSDGEDGILIKNFNYSDAPKSVEWVLLSNNYDNSEDIFTPYIGCDKVPDYVSQDWTKAEAARNNRHPTNN